MTGSPSPPTYDNVVIGGGFYGCCVALFFHGLGRRVLLLEAGPDLLLRASYVNQARIHNGYHYPRSMVTAIRSYVNFPRFVLDFSGCVYNDFIKLYAIARNHSKVSAYQFQKVFREIGAEVEAAPDEYRRLFDEDMVEGVFQVQEYAFDAAKLRFLMKERLCEAEIPIKYGTTVRRIAETGDSDGTLELTTEEGERVVAQEVTVCTYSRINHLLHDSGLPLLPLKHEVAEVALIRPPDVLSRIGVTVMDGPFFSTMPFPSRGLHSLTHVRYTPHESWSDQEAYQGYSEQAKRLLCPSNALYMQRDAQRFMPLLRDAEYVDSLFELKTVLTQNEQDDGRPILFRHDYGLKNLSVIMGGKIDNIYDIVRKMQAVYE